MKVLCVADLHLDMWLEEKKDPFNGVDISDVDLLVLAGDITNKAHVQWKYALSWLSERIDPGRIKIGPGNHEPYGGAVDREDKLDAIARDFGAQFIQKSSFIAGTTRFLFCTLWTDMALSGDLTGNERLARNRMNDYARVRLAGAGHRKISPMDTCAIHRDHLRWLGDELACDPVGQWDETIVVTHHAPHARSLTTGRAGDVPFCYASDLEAFILQTNPARWLHGHTHEPADYRIGATRITNVSIGYPDPDNAPRFDAKFPGFLELDTPKADLRPDW